MNGLKEISIHDLEGFHIGNAEYEEHRTGLTVILPEHGACCGLDVRGGGPASRESALLNPLADNSCVNAVALSGGSAFGLNSTSGIMQYLEERKEGFMTDAGVVPIVCASCIFDLEMDNIVRPDARLGYQACLNAEKDNYQDGNKGCGTGATVGKAYGSEHMMNSGIGSIAYQCGDLKVGAIAAVNCMGDVFDEHGNQIAGCLDYETNQFMSAEEAFYMRQVPLQKHTNTTIGVILTNASFDKTHLTKIAGMAHDGMARAISPVHTMFDGDSIYALSKGNVVSDVNTVGILAARAFSEAIRNAVKHTTSAYGLKCYSDVIRSH